MGIVTVHSARNHLLARRTCTLATSVGAPAFLRTIAALERTVHARLAYAGAINVTPGPGTFSRVRLGVVTANALAWALRIPLRVRGRRVALAKPEYGAPPSIT